MSDFARSYETSAESFVALRVRARSELSIVANLEARGVESLCPTYPIRKQWCDRVKIVQAALFPCYIFCRFSPIFRREIVTTPGVQEVVGNGRYPIPLDERDLELIQRLTAEGLSATPFPMYVPGRRIKITAGPLTGLEGSLVRVKNEARIVLSLDLLQRSVVTEVPEDSIRFL